MNNRLPAEVLVNIAKYLDQISQKQSSLVCQSWCQPFQSVIFQRAVFLTPQQLTSYCNQHASFRQQTHSLHFNVPLTDEILEQFAIMSPHVHTLTLFINLLNPISITKTISVIQKYWVHSLVKIRMDELLLPKVLPLLSHQLEDVTGSYGAFFTTNGATTTMMPLPKLRILDIEGDGDEETILTAKILNDMREAYSQLKKLTVSYFIFGSITEQEQTQLSPFSLVRSFHILNCDDPDNHYPQIISMFIDLQETSFLRSTNMQSENAVERQNQYLQIVNKYPNLREFNIDYLFGRHIIPQDTYYFARSSKFLTSIHLELPSHTGIITQRHLMDISAMISILGHLKKIKIWGLCHIETGESFEHYLYGTEGYCDLEMTLEEEPQDLLGMTMGIVVEEDPEADGREPEEGLQAQQRQRLHLTTTTDEGEQEKHALVEKVIHRGVTYESHVFEDGSLFGNGESLIKDGICVTTVKKRLPRLTQQDDNDAYLQWQVDEIPRFQVWFTDDIKAYGLTSLYLEMATIRTPSFYWLTRHCPLLEELNVMQTEPYPTCQVYLGNRLHTFSLSLDKRYDKFKLPFICLFDQDYNQRCLEYVPKEKKFMETENANYINSIANIYKIEIEYKPALKDLTISGNTISLC